MVTNLYLLLDILEQKEGNLLGYDLIWKGIEITSGAQREHRYEQLCKNAAAKGLGKDVEFYLEFFKYGCPPHGGFAIGLSRFTMLLLNIDTVVVSSPIFITLTFGLFAAI